MNLVVDTNIVFSTLLNPHSTIGEILMNIQDDLTFFAPDLLKNELDKYSLKIETYSKLNKKEISVIKELVLSNINLVSEELISHDSWIKAFEVTKAIDEDDTPFVALAIDLNALLWTGDKILSGGIMKRDVNLTITTNDLKKLLEK